MSFKHKYVFGNKEIRYTFRYKIKASSDRGVDKLEIQNIQV